LTKRPPPGTIVFNLEMFHEFGTGFVHTWDTLSFSILTCHANAIMSHSSMDQSGMPVSIKDTLSYETLLSEESIFNYWEFLCGYEKLKVNGQVIYNSIKISRFLPRRKKANGIC